MYVAEHTPEQALKGPVNFEAFVWHVVTMATKN